MHLQSLKLLTLMVLQMHLQENTLFDLDLEVTQKVADYPLQHVTYASAKFGVGRKIHYWVM